MNTHSFDPYYDWLGIAPKDQPPNHYRLLAIDLFEENANVISHAADRQMRHVRAFQSGPHAAESQRLLNAISTARVCLLDTEQRAAYDAQLRKELAPAQPTVPGDAADDEPDPAIFGEYLLLDQIARGGTGQVFKARHRTMGRMVALKILSPQATQSSRVVARFRRKVQILASFDHPNLIAAFDAGERNGTHFLTMEYVDGTDLRTLQQRFRPLAAPYVAGYLAHAACGLAYAHDHGVYHRNVKPSNLLVDRNGVVKVIGLGLALIDLMNNPLGIERDADDPAQTGRTLGTLDYMAPEQFVDSTRVDQRADIYSLGCTLYVSLTGQPPFSATTPMDKFVAHRDRPIPLLRQLRPDVPDSLEAVYQRMLAKQPENRYQSMHEVAAELESIGRELQATVTPPPVFRAQGRTTDAGPSALPGLAPWEPPQYPPG